MRTTFINTLNELAAEDQRINLFVGDLGFNVVNEFAADYPDRFLNAGVSEQNMTGMAAGMALAGDTVVFTYSIGCFPTVRCLEQVRNDVCYHNANVKIITVGGGVAYGVQGHTHHVIEDFALMRAMPNMVVAAPADPAEAEAVTRLAVKTSGPWYIRLGKNGEPVIHGNGLKNLNVGEAIRLQDGDDGTIIATGAITYEAYAAVQQLAENGLQIRLLSMPFVKPIDVDAVQSAARETPWIITIEEHHGFGGIGSAVAEITAELPSPAQLKRLHYPEILTELGSQEYLRRHYSLDAESIQNVVLAIIE